MAGQAFCGFGCLLEPGFDDTDDELRSIRAERGVDGVGKSLDSLLILTIAVCTVLATGVTIHDVNDGKPNPIVRELHQGLNRVEQWIHVASGSASGWIGHSAASVA